MLAVDFDDELSSDAGEVCEEGSDGMLAPELQAAHAVGSQEFPHCLLSAAVGQAKVSRSLGPFLG